jgi:hypothetical protein
MLSAAGWPASVAVVVTVLVAPSVLGRIVRGVVHGEHLPVHSQHLKGF